MNNSVRIGSFVLSCALAGAVFAQAAPAPVAPAPGAMGASSEFGTIDTNKDGKVSSTEAQSNTDLRSAFTSLDADKDTYLSQSEFAKWNKSGKAGAMPSPGGAAGAAGSDRTNSGASSNSSSEASSASPQSTEQAEQK